MKNFFIQDLFHWVELKEVFYLTLVEGEVVTKKMPLNDQWPVTLHGVEIKLGDITIARFDTDKTVDIFQKNVNSQLASSVGVTPPTFVKVSTGGVCLQEEADAIEQKKEKDFEEFQKKLLEQEQCLSENLSPEILGKKIRGFECPHLEFSSRWDRDSDRPLCTCKACGQII